ncbi:MAG: exosortase/archaeosortase family protein [Deltaproteobacteria bacterium]|nr:exosortase/archaeosortase family protein [Deltaproteobacteria bacterium]
MRKLKRLFRKKRYRVVLNYLTLGIIALMLAALYANPFRFAWREWFAAGSYYSHAPLIPIISGFLIWRKRGDFPYIAVNYSMLGFAFLVPGFLLRLLGDVWGSNSISLLSLPCFLTGIALFLFGRKMTRTVLFPLCFLLFMVTIPASLLDVLTFNMKLFAARLSAGPMQLLAYPLIREGNVIHMTQSTVGVEDACSGLGSLISLLALSTLCAYLVRASYPRRILLVLAAVPIAIIANVFRIIGTCLVANSFGAGIATHEVVHIAFGMMVFIIALGILILIGRAIKCRFSIGDVW